MQKNGGKFNFNALNFAIPRQGVNLHIFNMLK